jgi:tetratricopeptide (TPR) repeat protein
MQLAIETGSGHAEHVAWCRAQLALMLWRNGRLVDAERVLAPALEQAPEHVDVLWVAARLQASRQDYTAAIELYERGVAIAPHYALLVELADLYEWTGREAEGHATRVRIEAMHQQPGADGEPGPLQIARYYADHDRRPAEAVRLAEAAHAARATRASADTLAWAYFKAGRLEEAEHALRDALAPGRREADLLFHAGLIHAGLGQRGAAQQYLYEALSLNPYFDVRGARDAAEALRTLAARR